MDDHVYPYWMHHATRPSVLVTRDEELAQLPNGYRYDPFTPEELAAVSTEQDEQEAAAIEGLRQQHLTQQQVLQAALEAKDRELIQLRGQLESAQGLPPVSSPPADQDTSDAPQGRRR